MATRKQLLSDVVRVHKNTTRKVSRLNNKGVKITGTRNDPRENLKDVRQMSSRELREYRQRLGEFNSRGTSFVPGVRKTALDASKFREYKRLEALYNSNLKERIDTFGDVKIPGNDLTISERYQRMIPKGRSIGGGTSRFHPYNRTSTGFPNDKAIDKAIEDMEKRLVPGFVAQQDQKIRENFMRLMQYSDRPDVLEAAEALTPEQFEILWNFDNLVSNAAENYQIMLDLLSAKADATDREAANEIYDEMKKKFDAVQKQDLFNSSDVQGDTVRAMGGRMTDKNRKTLAKVERAQNKAEELMLLDLYTSGARPMDEFGKSLAAKHIPTTKQVDKARAQLEARRRKSGYYNK